MEVKIKIVSQEAIDFVRTGVKERIDSKRKGKKRTMKCGAAPR